ncbi:MAG: transcriptional repressor [Nitrosopumilales archaeon CG15_BIG_FIL_POST_REV_8_21_14_020_37_12]|nr:MAG: transcriptional repressor [Nitrosopumilales archaeon CG15_BIG_FIL_POST_REV_8_21_14_020_37_12]
MQLEQIVMSLRDEGHRITPQRIAIMDYLLHTKDHPSADQVHSVVRKRYPMTSLSTVYKTLDLLREKKLVNEIEVWGEARFDAQVDEHINLVCLNCGNIEDIDEKALKNIQAKIAKKSDYLIIKGSFEMHGYCSKCKTEFQ